jgi:hypothetical protein
MSTTTHVVTCVSDVHLLAPEAVPSCSSWARRLPTLVGADR